MNEFELINHFFGRSNKKDILGIGDDAAVILPTPGYQLCVSTDTLALNRHFFNDVDPKKLGHKVLAVNLSDIAAMGATPRWALLSLSIPQINKDWLASFSNGFFDLADQFNVNLVGGDTVRAPLSFTVTLIGEALPNFALCRSGAQLDDDIWVSGEIGLAALALYQRTQQKNEIPSNVHKLCQKRLDCPQPRLILGQALQGIANACIDISDGLLSDLSHILKQSQCGAIVWFESIPSHIYIKKNVQQYRDCLLSGGDDYELLFTASKKMRSSIKLIAKKLALSLTRIGYICSELGLTVLDEFDQPITLYKKGFDHFAAL